MMCECAQGESCWSLCPQYSSTIYCAIKCSSGVVFQVAPDYQKGFVCSLLKDEEWIAVASPCYCMDVAVVDVQRRPSRRFIQKLKSRGSSKLGIYTYSIT